MRNKILESQGSDMLKILMQLCRDEERSILHQSTIYGVGDDTSVDLAHLTGWLPMRSIVNIMVGSPRLSLSRLQVMVITSEAIVVDGRVNYLQFCPVAAKTIELMFEPKALRQRAELIQTSDLSPEVLLNGTSNEVFVVRLQTLFQSFDVDKVGELNAKQFRAMLESMELMLSPAEILSIMAIADYNNNGLISFDEFSKFCIKNLIHLEREKYIRILQKAIHGSVVSDENTAAVDRAALLNTLQILFADLDVEGKGVVSYSQLQDIFIKLNTNLTQYQILFLISQCHSNEFGFVEYGKCIDTCVDFLQVLYTIEAEGDENDFDVVFQHRIESFQNSWENNVDYIAQNLQRELKLLDHILDEEAKRHMLIRIAQNRLNGLNQSESNIFISMMLCEHSDGVVSDEELYEMVCKIRKHSLVRGALENSKASTLAKYMLSVFSNAAEEFRKLKNEPEVPLVLPARCIISALENDPKIPMNRCQILGLLAWSDAFQGVSTGIDYREFAFFNIRSR